MLTRLKVSGFKNLVDIDVRFGPFTCIAGANGVGKSNLFDAIRFLSALADRRLIDAASAVRDESYRTSDIRSLFHRVGDNYANEMSFEAEMIIPAEGVDDLGQEAKATITFLRYILKLSYRKDEGPESLGPLEITKEELTHFNMTDANKYLLFPKSAAWRGSTIKGKGRRGSPFISTEGQGKNRVIKLHQDGGSRGKPLSRSAANLPRTVLSATNATESPTALLARKEMMSWRLLQLEPSALRKPDEFNAPTKLTADGSHLAATLYHLARLNKGRNGRSVGIPSPQIYAQIANRLAELIDDAYEVWVDRDERRELLTLQVRGRDGTSHPAKALSDGTLRFLALAVLELEPEAQGIICLEEPENGIHPERIPAMLTLLRDIATDTNQAVSPDNPMRQVIINTHSPVVVLQVPDDSLLMAELKETVGGQRYKRLSLSALSKTWREKDSRTNIVSKGQLLSYWVPVSPVSVEIGENGDSVNALPGAAPPKSRRIIDRQDLQPPLPFPTIDDERNTIHPVT